MDTAPAAPPPPTGPAPPPSAVLTSWPRSAQLTTAFLLGVCLTLLTGQALGLLRWGSRPTDLDPAPVAGYRIDLNRATRAELLQIPGVGPALADKIIAHRTEHGGFRTVEDLGQISGIGPATLSRLRPWVVVSFEESEPAPATPVALIKKPAPAPNLTEPTNPVEVHHSTGKKESALAGPLDVNQATQEELQRLPGIGPKMAQRILDERTKAPFKSVDDLRRVSGIGVKTLEKLRPHVRVGEASPSVVTAQ